MFTTALKISLRGRVWRRFRDVILNRAALMRSRQSLARLDDHLLQDIGLTRHEAETETQRPAWDAPLHWQQRES